MAVLQSRWRRLPPTREARFEQHTGVRAHGEDGDRRHGAESGGVERKVGPTRRLEYHIVRVLVLGDDLDNRQRWRMAACPAEDVRECLELLDGGFEHGACAGRQAGMIV